MSKQLWEILVPTMFNDGRPVKVAYHRKWDEKVIAISGGLTIMPVAKGQWVSENNQLFKERMIPVRILATREEIEHIVDMTIDHYEQLAVLAYKVSDDAILKSADKSVIEKWKNKNKIGMRTYDWADVVEETNEDE